MRSLHYPLLLAALLCAGVGQCATAGAPSLAIATVTTLFANAVGPSAPNAMAVDADGNIYLAGLVFGAFPATPGAAQVQPGGGMCTILVPTGFIGSIPEQVPCPDAFVVKLGISGNTTKIVWATLLGGPGYDTATAIALDAAGNVYITGASSGQFPTTSGSFAPSTSGSNNAVFVAKFNPQGSQVLYSTYLPESLQGMAGDTGPQATGIAADAAGNAYITGNNVNHVSIAKLSPDGSARLYNTILAGDVGEYSSAIASDAAGNAYVTGTTYSPGFPVTAGAFQTKLTGNPSAFVAHLDPEGNIVYSTFLGGSGFLYASGIQIDAQGAAYVAGQTTSLDFPTTAGAWEPQPVIPMWRSNPPSPGGFVAKLSAAGDKLAFSTYVFADEGGVRALAPDGVGGVYVAGTTAAGVAVTPSAPQPCFSGYSNAYVAHLNAAGALVDRTYVGGPNTPPPFALALAEGALYLGPTELVRLQFAGPGYVPSPCLSPDILNAGTFSNGGSYINTGPVAPGEWISLTGIGMGPETGVANQLSPDGVISTELAGVRVFFDGNPAPLLYVQSQQINAIAPFELSAGATTALHIEYQGASTNTVNVTVGVANPGVFRLAGGAAAVNQDGTLNSPSNPAKVGSIISIYGTGFGQTNPPGVTGSLFPLMAAPLVPAAMMPLQVVIGQVPAQVLYAGAAPGEIAGIDQINVLVPAPQQGNGPAVALAVASGIQDPVFLTVYVQP